MIQDRNTWTDVICCTLTRYLREQIDLYCSIRYQHLKNLHKLAYIIISELRIVEFECLKLHFKSCTKITGDQDNDKSEKLSE